MTGVEALRVRTRWADDAVRGLVAAAPALTDDQRRRVAGLLRSGDKA